MANNAQNSHIDVLNSFFASGAKDSKVQTIGLRIEHFIVYEDTSEAVPYEGASGVSYILNELASYYPDAKIKRGGPLLSFSTDKFSVNLKPAAQIEISINDLEELASTERIYQTFRDNLDDILSIHGMVCQTVGYQPASKAQDIPLIPSSRFEYMDKYFKTSGSLGVNMMRGTCATVVSIDYSDEEDFGRKFRAAYVLSPYFKLLCDNSPVFEGQPNERHLLRSYIRANSDKNRNNIVPGIFKADFGFNDYADYLLTTPPIYLPSLDGSTDVYTGDRTCQEILNDRDVTEGYIKHFTSMVFPDIRLKQYIEIRVADSLPFDLAFAYTALIKGIFYNEKALKYIDELISNESIDENKISKTTNDLENNAWDGKFYSMSVSDAHDIFVDFAYEYLSEDEKRYVSIFKDV